MLTTLVCCPASVGRSAVNSSAVGFLCQAQAHTHVLASGNGLQRWNAVVTLRPSSQWHCMPDGVPNWNPPRQPTAVELPYLHAGDIGLIYRRVRREHGRQRLHQQRPRDARLEVLAAVLAESAQEMRIKYQELSPVSWAFLHCGFVPNVEYGAVETAQGLRTEDCLGHSFHNSAGHLFN